MENKFDLTRFHSTFFQESLDGLAVMESGLLELSVGSGQADPEIINNVFRAAHSIKGGSATFGFQELTSFTHRLETILDTLRETGKTPDARTTEALLQATDCLRELIDAERESRPPDRGLLDRITTDLDIILSPSQPPIAKASPSATPAGLPEELPSGAAGADLHVSFHPHNDIFFSGSDPLHFISELSAFGQVSSVVDISAIPPVLELNTELCFLKWEMRLYGAASRESEVREVFEWIEEKCELTIGAGPDQPVERVIAHQVTPEAAKEAAAVQPQSARPEPSPVKEPSTAKLAKASKPAGDATSIRVATEKLDAMVNLVGELVITQSMLTCIGETFQMSQLAKLREGIAQLSRNTRELQETVLKIRMLPISNLFDRFPRAIHDLCSKLGKRARLETSGEQTEVDKTVLEKLSDPLLHLVRNSMDHGIEAPELRRNAGKPEEGTLHLHAEHRGGNLVIEISDDGAGLNEQGILKRARERGLIGPDDVLATADIYSLIFAPGFSTAQQVTDLSGRGVGMDVVRRNVEELGGRIDLASRSGLGTTTTIQLPLTLAIMEGQLLRIGEQSFVVPLTSIVESLRIDKTALHVIANSTEVYRLRAEYLPIVHLDRLFNIIPDDKPMEQSLLVVVESRGRKVALRTDELLAQQQVVVKSLEANFERVHGLSGATILGDGTIALILDVAAVIETPQAKHSKSTHLEPLETKYEQLALPAVH